MTASETARWVTLRCEMCNAPPVNAPLPPEGFGAYGVRHTCGHLPSWVFHETARSGDQAVRDA